MCFCCVSVSADNATQNQQMPLQSKTAISGSQFSFRSVTALSVESSGSRESLSSGANPERNTPSLRSIDIVVLLQRREFAIRDLINKRGLWPRKEGI